MDATTIALLTLTIPLITAIVSFATAILNIKALKARQEKQILIAETHTKETKTVFGMLKYLFDKLFWAAAITLPIYLIYRNLISDQPVTSKTIFFIAFYISTFFFNVISLIALYSFKQVRKVIENMNIALGKAADIDRKIIDIIEKQQNITNKIIPPLV